MMHFVLFIVILYLITIRAQEIETSIFEKYREEWEARRADKIQCVRDCQAPAVCTQLTLLNLPNLPSSNQDTTELGPCSQNYEITPCCREKVRGLEFSRLNSGELFYISLYNKYSWWKAQKTCRERGLELWKPSKKDIGQIAAYFNSIEWLKSRLYKFEVWFGGIQQFYLQDNSYSRPYNVRIPQCIVMNNWNSSADVTSKRPCSNMAAFLCGVPKRCIAMTCGISSVNTQAPNTKKQTTDDSQITTSELPSSVGYVISSTSGDLREPPVQEVQIPVETTNSAPLRLPSPPGAAKCSTKLGCQAKDIQSAIVGRKAAPKFNPTIYTVCGKRYYISNYPQNYEESSQQCCSDKMQLATASNVDDFKCIMEFYKMSKILVKEGRLWMAGIGNGTDGTYDYRWCTTMGWGMPFSGDEPWLPGEPKEGQNTRCVILKLINNTNPIGLATVPCTTSLRYMCEEYSPPKLQQVNEPVCPNNKCEINAINSSKRLRKIAPLIQPKINYFNRRFYYLGFNTKNFNQALLECCSDEMQLMNFDDPNEWEVLEKLINLEPRSGIRFWISGYVYAKKRMYRWCGNDSPVIDASLLPWLKNEPKLSMKSNNSNLCIGIEFTESKPRKPKGLFVSNCNVQLRYICESEKCEVAGQKKSKTPSKVKVASQMGCHSKCPKTNCRNMTTPNNVTHLLQTVSDTSFNYHQICNKSYILSSIQEDFKSAFERCSCFVKNYYPLIINSAQEFYCLAQFIKGLRGSSVWTSATSIDCKGNTGWCGSKTRLSREIEDLSTANNSGKGECLALISTSKQMILSYENCSSSFMALCELQESMP